MKRIIFLLLFSSIVPCLYGQFYIEPSVGYTFSSHPEENHSVVIIENQKTIYTTKLRYGEGMQVGLNLGYSLKDIFFVELNTKKTIYSKYNVSTERPALSLLDLQSLNNFYLSGYFGEIDYNSSIFQIAPLIGYKVQKNKYNIYFKIGPNFMKSTINKTLKYINLEMENLELYPLNTVKETEYSGKLDMGWQADVGLCYSIKQNLQFVLDFVTVYNNYKITKAEVKYFEIDGISHLYEYENTNLAIDKDGKRINHSHYGINIGLKYIINRKE